MRQQRPSSCVLQSSKTPVTKGEVARLNEQLNVLTAELAAKNALIEDLRDQLKTVRISGRRQQMQLNQPDRFAYTQNFKFLQDATKAERLRQQLAQMERFQQVQIQNMRAENAKIIGNLQRQLQEQRTINEEMAKQLGHTRRAFQANGSSQEFDSTVQQFPINQYDNVETEVQHITNGSFQQPSISESV